MSLYQLQKFLFDINRDRDLQSRCRADLPAVLERYDLNAEERGALAAGDIGLIYVLGANGQLLMHYAAFLGMPWADYLADAYGGQPSRTGSRRRLYDDDSAG
jgi:hypothetical protein